MNYSLPQVAAIDLFCGAGGLSYGLVSAGVDVTAGADIDRLCRYPFETNICGAKFLHRDARNLAGDELCVLWPKGSIRLLAGCAPCQPFSPYRRGADVSSDERWALLGEFKRLVQQTRPELITTENVPRLAGTAVFRDFHDTLLDLGYSVDYRSCSGPDYGVPQKRRRLVLLASNLGSIKIPDGHLSGLQPKTVGNTIRHLPRIQSGQACKSDPLHRSRALTQLNLARIKASYPGGTWRDWPDELRSPCHRRVSGQGFTDVYARMSWDQPSPTLTTYFYNFGAGRFGHPEQHRAISIREAAMLQGFPDGYSFVQPGAPIHFTTLGRLIGNAVPPPLGSMIGRTFIDHLKENNISD